MLLSTQGLTELLQDKDLVRTFFWVLDPHPPTSGRNPSITEGWDLGPLLTRKHSSVLVFCEPELYPQGYSSTTLPGWVSQSDCFTLHNLVELGVSVCAILWMVH
jgi:hypothetical protein